jgi:tRNA(Arg) A34 adenosine deaminase TadA
MSAGTELGECLSDSAPAHRMIRELRHQLPDSTRARREDFVVTDDKVLMRLALDEASAASDRGDPGFGAVVARAGQILARAGSTEVTDRNPLAPDGLTVLREACRRLDTSDLSDCIFYGTAEPCPMCSAALLQTKIGRIVLGAGGSALAEVLGPRAVLIEDLAADYTVQPQVERGLESEAALAILSRSLTDGPPAH